MTDPRVPRVEVRKKPVAEADWEVTLSFSAQPNEPLTLHFADSYVAKNPNEVGRLIATAMFELAK